MCSRYPTKILLQALCILAPTSFVRANDIVGAPYIDPVTSLPMAAFPNLGYMYDGRDWVSSSGMALWHSSPPYLAYSDRAVRWGTDGTGTVLQDLSPVSGQSFPYGINADGVVVGESEKYIAGQPKGTRAVRWGADGVPFELGNLGVSSNGAVEVAATCINSSGVIAGSAQKYSTVYPYFLGDRAVRWDTNGNITELQVLNTDSYGKTFAGVSDMNDAGICVGDAEFYLAGVDKGTRPTLWDATGHITRLSDLGTDNTGTTSGSAIRVNSSGISVGNVRKYSAGVFLGSRAVRWDVAGNGVELQDLGTDPSGATKTTVLDLNSSGVAVGYATKYVSGTLRGNAAVRWAPDGTATELTTPEGGATARALNDAGYVIGMSSTAYLWKPDNTPVPLDSLLPAASGWSSIYEVDAISSTGWVLGIGYFDADGAGGSDPFLRPFLLRAHPSPVARAPEGTQVGSVGSGLLQLSTPSEIGYVSLTSGQVEAIALDLTGTGDISSALADLSFVSGGNYSVITSGPLLNDLRGLYHTDFDAVIQFSPTEHQFSLLAASLPSAFSWDFQGLGVSVAAIAAVPEPSISFLMAGMLLLCPRRRAILRGLRQES